MNLIRCLLLWSQDRSLLKALGLAKYLLIPVDVMNALWPCPSQYFRKQLLSGIADLKLLVNQHQCAKFRERLADACVAVGMDPPFPAVYTLPPLLRT